MIFKWAGSAAEAAPLEPAKSAESARTCKVSIQTECRATPPRGFWRIQMGFAQSAALRKLASSRRLPMETPGSRTSPSEFLWKTPNGVTAAVENFGQRRVFLERFRTVSFFSGFSCSATHLRLICVRFCAGGYPQSLPGGATVSLGGARCAQVRFIIVFLSDLGVHLGRHFRTCCIV